MTRARCSRAACLRTQLVPRLLLAGRQGGAAWRRDRQIVKQLGRRAAACSPRALRVHIVHTVCTLRAAAADPHLRFAPRACRRARQVSLGHKCVHQAIGYQEIEERFTFEQRVASYGLVKLTTWRWQGR